MTDQLTTIKSDKWTNERIRHPPLAVEDVRRVDLRKESKYNLTPLTFSFSFPFDWEEIAFRDAFFPCFLYTSWLTSSETESWDWLVRHLEWQLPQVIIILSFAVSFSTSSRKSSLDCLNEIDKEKAIAWKRKETKRKECQGTKETKGKESHNVCVGLSQEEEQVSPPSVHAHISHPCV